MKLTEAQALSRLTSHDHGVLSTLHAQRGVDAVPVVYAATGGFVGVPIDRVKPKSSLRLQRQANLEADPRATLLIEHWDRDDWSKLWWVRAELQYEGPDTNDAAVNARSAALAVRLEDAFVQYRDQPFAAILVLRIAAISGWAASAS